MSLSYKVLGQVYPSANSLTTLCTVASTYSVISSIVVCNQSTAATDYFRISIAVGGASDSQKQYIYGGSTGMGLSLTANNTFVATLGLTLVSGDVIRVLSLNGTSSFSVFGSQIV